MKGDEQFEIPGGAFAGPIYWSLHDAGLARVDTSPATTATSPTPPTTTVTKPVESGVIVGFDDAPRNEDLEVVTDLGMVVPVAGSTDRSPIVRFSDFGTGTALAVNPSTGEVLRVDTAGKVWRNVIAVEDADGTIVDAALSSEDYSTPSGPDPILYVSRKAVADDGTERYTLVNYGLSNDNDLVNEFGRWPTAWTCDGRDGPGTCGSIEFEGTKVALGDGTFNETFNPVFAALPAVEVEAVTPTTPDSQCPPNDSMPFFGVRRARISTASAAWQVELVCSATDEQGRYLGFDPQTDGSVLVHGDLRSTTRDESRPTGILLRADGSIMPFDLPDHSWEMALVDGQVRTLSAVPGESVKLLVLR